MDPIDIVCGIERVRDPKFIPTSGEQLGIYGASARIIRRHVIRAASLICYRPTLFALIAAFCYLAEFASPLKIIRRLVGAVGIEFIKAQNLKEFCGACCSRKSFVVLSRNYCCHAGTAVSLADTH
jgi:hypothetical protein